VPVIGSAIPALTELVRDNVNGRLHPAGNAPALAAILKELAANPERVGEWRSNLTSVRTMDDVTADYLAMYAA
jgi:glycosyltransferase involved in cell wall biosynthesis